MGVGVELAGLAGISGTLQAANRSKSKSKGMRCLIRMKDLWMRE